MWARALRTLVRLWKSWPCSINRWVAWRVARARWNWHRWPWVFPRSSSSEDLLPVRPGQARGLDEVQALLQGLDGLDHVALEQVDPAEGQPEPRLLGMPRLVRQALRRGLEGPHGTRQVAGADPEEGFLPEEPGQLVAVGRRRGLPVGGQDRLGIPQSFQGRLEGRPLPSGLGQHPPPDRGLGPGVR